MRRLALLLLLCAPIASAQTQSIINTGSDAGLTYSWDFNVTTTLVNFPEGTPGYGEQYVNANMSGTLDINDKPCTIWINDTWQFMPNETMIMAGWGLWNPIADQSEWELITTPNGAYVQYDQYTGSANTYESLGAGSVVTPEPATWVMMLCGLTIVGGLFWRRNVVSAGRSTSLL